MVNRSCHEMFVVVNPSECCPRDLLLWVVVCEVVLVVVTFSVSIRCLRVLFFYELVAVEFSFFVAVAIYVLVAL